MTATTVDPTLVSFITGGTLPPDASSYIERRADRELLDVAVLALACLAVISYRTMLRTRGTEAAVRAQSAGTQHLLYLSDMNLLPRECDSNDVGASLDGTAIVWSAD